MNGKQQALQQDTLAKAQLARSLLISASSEQAAFLQDLHAVQGAGNVIQGSIYNVRKRFIKLLGAVKDHEELTFKAAKQLCGIMGSLEMRLKLGIKDGWMRRLSLKAELPHLHRNPNWGW